MDRQNQGRGMKGGRRSRVGFFKGKMMAAFTQPAASSPNLNTTTTSFLRHPPHSTTYVASSSAQPNVSFPLQPSAAESSNNEMEKKLNKLAEKLFGSPVAADDTIDVRASSYISSVQERFKRDEKL
ncbi:PREDICTED: uncharacterized protein LOC104821133 isoform X3 [Tarenaya hassleriana]|uniref:uncharacterized protein LOC104821133 isoform X3 n=1 Tax=Tarenaya hassleriana TaxID=28532 RepID=UPI00053C5551|nr:PREDICTED: uncharacterized protein LOC104821133 isoform X3 [Tarenaya hassleriana]